HRPGRNTEMSTTELLAKTKAAADARAAETRAKYLKLVKEVAAGKKLDPEKVVDALTLFGVTADEFQAEVELAQRRAAWRAEALRLPQLRADLDLVAL